jgi:predicted phage baseplate assembly protein
MSLPLPRLDNRTFDQLVEEGTALLPRYAPEWTDHNLHDPGITLIDLFAWLVEMDMYRLDRTSQAAFRAFLRLVGIEPRPPHVAETVLVFQVAKGNQPIPLSHGIQIASQDGNVTFQTTRNLLVCKSQLSAVLTGPEDTLVDCTTQNQSAGKRFAPFGSDPQPNDALYLGFDQPLPPNGSRVSVFVWVNSPESDAALRGRLIDECRAARARLKECRIDPSRSHPSVWQHYSVRTVWEYYARAENESGKWLPLARVLDETRALTLSGAVRFTMPAAPSHAKGAVRTKPDLLFIRCRLVSGYYECPPAIQYIALNAVPVRHAVDVSTIQEYTSNGRAGQTFPLQRPPVVPGSTRLTMKVNGTNEEWHEALDWDRIGPHDRAYVLTPETGEICFGDGRRGFVPKDKAQIQVTRYQMGGGSSGNVPAGRLVNVLKAIDVKVQQPFDASGGADAESLTDAKARAFAWMTEPHRAVTLDDFERIALAIPGVPVKRVHALPDYDPALPCLPALGSVTVVVVPACANPIPEPGPDMLRAVEQYLNRRRTLTTELHVIGPSFVTVAVRATLHTGVNVDSKRLMADAKSGLNTFLDPLRGGADGRGWPIGRDVYQSEVMALLNALPGVDFVDDVGLIIESELDVYQGYVTWMQVFERDESTAMVRAQLRIEPDRVASRLVAQAQIELQKHFRSQRGRSKHVPQSARRDEVAMILSAVPGVVSVENVKLEDDPGSGALCGNVPVCAHSLIIPGKHQITVSGARTCKLLRAKPPVC